MADLPRWESFGGLTTLRREMDRLFERFLGREASPLARRHRRLKSPTRQRRSS